MRRMIKGRMYPGSKGTCRRMWPTGTKVKDGKAQDFATNLKIVEVGDVFEKDTKIYVSDFDGLLANEARFTDSTGYTSIPVAKISTDKTKYPGVAYIIQAITTEKSIYTKHPTPVIVIAYASGTTQSFYNTSFSWDENQQLWYTTIDQCEPWTVAEDMGGLKYLEIEE